MDNPQHYQPLSHALHPPSAAGRTHYTTTGQHAGYAQQDVTEQSGQVQSQNLRRPEEEEEEEEEEDEDEGLVEEQLNQTDVEMHPSGPSSPKGSTSNDPQSHNPQSTPQATQSTPIPEKRRPGRPRGSKNRKPRISGKNETHFYANQSGSSTAASATLAALPSHPNITPQNQPYYEFQWRMLNLCAEFYGAAEELVKATSPLVVAQCYHLGPGVKVDPLTMVGEAKRVCDTLLANPSQLVTNPPPPVYPVLPTISMYPPVMQPPVSGPSTSSTTTAIPAALPTTGTPAGTSNVVTSSTSFVVPLGQPGYPQYQLYGHPSPHAQYPTTPYYPPYPTYPTPYYQHPHTQPPQTLSAPVASTSGTITSAAVPAVSNTQSAATITTTPTTGGTMIGNSGPWTEEETERLKKLAEESKGRGGQAGEMDWNWVVTEWGHSRTRHQILIQANKLNLKESATRGTKRRREEGQADVSGVTISTSFQPSAATSSTSIPTAPAAATLTPTGVASSSPAPSLSHSTTNTTPGASPALQSQQRPSSAAATAVGNSATQTTTATTTTTIVAPSTKLPWPMPTVAVNSPVSVLSTPASTSTAATSPSVATHGHDQRSSYYRPRPTTSDAGKASQHHQQQHHYLYAQNGHTGSGGMAYRKENGK